jgi:hypothetical protein
MKSSRNHLRAFGGVLERYGLTFEPAHIAAEEYESIINSPMEKGVVGVDGEPFCAGGRR